MNKKYWLRGSIGGLLISFVALYVIGLFSEPAIMKQLNYNPFSFAQRFLLNPENMLIVTFILIIVLCAFFGAGVGMIYGKFKNRNVVQ